MITIVNATDIPISHSYPEWGKIADQIVIAKLIDKKIITAISDGKKITCGWKLEFEVIKSWKGNKKKIKLFAADFGFSYDPNIVVRHHDVVDFEHKEYFIFAVKWKGKKPRISSCGNKRIYLSEYPYRLYYPDQLIFKVLRDKNNKFDNGWIFEAKRRHGYPLICPENQMAREIKEYEKNPPYQIRIPFFIDCVVPKKKNTKP
jgi:hypothetical protein